MWEARASRFPEHTPSTREYYLLRSIFEEQFPSRCALETVPKVPSSSSSSSYSSSFSLRHSLALVTSLHAWFRPKGKARLFPM